MELLRSALQPLIGTQFDVLKLPKSILSGFEPSQVGSMVGALMDACIPQLSSIVKPEDRGRLSQVGLQKHAGILKDREGYPDYQHSSGLRAELKLIYVDPKDVQMKKPATPREPSARLTEKVTVKNVDPDKDVLLVIAYQLQPDKTEPELYVPTIVGPEIFPVSECVAARDERLVKQGGKWFGNYEVPAVLSKAGRTKRAAGKPLNESEYGRKKSEGKDYNADTNFGKLARIPHPELLRFLEKWCGSFEEGTDTPDEVSESPASLADEIAAATCAAESIRKNRK